MIIDMGQRWEWDFNYPSVHCPALLNHSLFHQVNKTGTQACLTWGDVLERSLLPVKDLSVTRRDVSTTSRRRLQTTWRLQCPEVVLMSPSRLLSFRDVSITSQRGHGDVAETSSVAPDWFLQGCRQDNVTTTAWNRSDSAQRMESLQSVPAEIKHV